MRVDLQPGFDLYPGTISILQKMTCTACTRAPCVHIFASLLAFFKDWEVILSNKEHLHDFYFLFFYTKVHYIPEYVREVVAGPGCSADLKGLGVYADKARQNAVKPCREEEEGR